MSVRPGNEAKRLRASSVRGNGDAAGPRSGAAILSRSWFTHVIALVIAMSWGMDCLAAEPTHRDVVYATVDQRPLRLDIYQPTKGAPGESAERPLVIWIHGGAWRAGSKERVPITSILDHGFAIASVEYRLSPEAKFPAQAHDIKAAIRFLRAEASRYGFDSRRFVIAGASAGGHLAALVGLSDGTAELEGSLGEQLDETSAVQATVSFYGASNLQTILSQSTPHGLSVRVPALKLLLGGLPEERPELARLASPVVHVDGGDPPMWLLHGDADPQMPVEQSRELAEACRAAGCTVHLEVLPGAVHGGEVFYTPERIEGLAGAILDSLGQSPAKSTDD